MVSCLLWEQEIAGSSPVSVTTFTAVTQLAECQFSKLDVAGSTPACRIFPLTQGNGCSS